MHHLCFFSVSDRVRVSGGHLCEAEAPTEATAETLSLRLPLAVPKIAFRLGAPSDFDRCATIALPSSATGGGRALCLTPGVNRPNKTKKELLFQAVLL